MSTHDDAYLKMTSDDLRASRVLSLAVKFFGSSRAIPSSTIAADLYPDLDERSFGRQYLRDRELLTTLGLHVCQVDDNGSDTLWTVDESASYVEGSGLTPEDARMLYVLCHDLTFDHSFAYRDELRIALAKIAQIYRGITIARSDTTSAREHKLLSLLVGCLNNRRAIEVTYTDAQGATSERQLALLGSFGLRDHTYFVASRVEKDGTLVPDSIRTYRLDRFDKARELRGCTYEIPLDFAVSDYERLPFQIGDFVGEARFSLPAELGSELTHATSCSGRVTEEGEPAVWTVFYSDLQAAASWAIGAGIVPLKPAELVECYRATLEQAAAYEPYDPALESSTCGDAGEGGSVATKGRPRRSAGRTGSITLTRQLVTLATSLSREGRIITATDIANNLGVDYEYARHLIALVSMSGADSFDYLPVVLSDDDDEVQLMQGAELDVRRVRLTRSETIALQAALTELGVAQDDPLAQTLIDAYAAPSFSLDDIARTLEAPATHADGPTMRICSHAISAGNGLEFWYRPVCGGAGSARRVQPHLVSRTDDNWYLDAYDLVREDNRVFRLDHMSELREVELDEEQRHEPKPRTQQDAPMVVVCFAEPRYLELFHWNRLEVVGSSERGIVCRLPLFGGNWLARHIVACGGTVSTSSEQLAAQVRTLAKA